MQPTSVAAEELISRPPDHTQLPDKDGAIVTNFQEHPQSNLLTGSVLPRLHEIHPDGQFCIGHDSGIYWRVTQPPLNGCKAPDWFYVPGVPPMLEGQMRRSYVLWNEGRRPLLIAEYVSGDGSEEHDKTPHTGKFWVYEQGICATYYAIFDAAKSSLEVFSLERGSYQPVAANAPGRFPIEPLGIELGIWHGKYRGMEMPWVRAWDAATGKMLPSEEERAKAAEERADTAEELLDDARNRVNEECERAENERRRAESQEKRATDADQRAQKLAERLRAWE